MNLTCFKNANVREFVVGRILCFRCGLCGYFFWTLFWMLWHLIWFLLDVLMLTENKPEKYFRYLTNWGYILLVVTSLVDFLTVVLTMLCCKSTVDANKQHSDKKVLKFIFPTWICFETAKCIALTISIGYFASLANGMDELDQKATSLSSIVFHVVNSVYVILNLFVSTKPVGMQHYVFSIVFALIYIGISIILNVACGIEPPYKNVTFSKFTVSTFGFLVWCLFAPPFIHWVIYRCKLEKVHKTTQTNEDLLESQNGVRNDQQTIHQQYYSTENEKNAWYTASKAAIMMNSNNGRTAVYAT